MSEEAISLGNLPGLGADEYPGFPADACPEKLMDLSKHHSVVADVLKKNPGLFDQLRGKQTSLGVELAKCVKTGMDNRGHPMIKTLGAVAGDAECYETFRPLFDHLIRERHGETSLQRAHAECLKPGTGRLPQRGVLSTARPDPTGRYVLSTHIRAARNLQGFRFPPAASFEERREVERLVVRAFGELPGDLKGNYLPLAGSMSHAATSICVPFT